MKECERMCIHCYLNIFNKKQYTRKIFLIKNNTEDKTNIRNVGKKNKINKIIDFKI